MHLKKHLLIIVFLGVYLQFSKQQNWFVSHSGTNNSSNGKTIFKLLVLIILIISNSVNAQIVTTNLDPTIRDVSDVNFGFNRRSGVGTWWTDNSFIDLVAEMNPDIIRYPGGTQANYWDWRTGQFIPNTDKVWGSKQVVTIPTFINVLPNRTKIVYVVNMARPTPATGIDVNTSEAVLKSNATLNLKIADMISALDEFVLEGKVPYAVELGNEFYFGNEESGIYHILENDGVFYSGWDTKNNQPYQSTSKQDATVINALFYLEQAKELVKQIKVAYPNMMFALTTTKSGNGTSSRDYWNNTIFDNLINNPEFATLKDNIYAVTQHHYLNDSYGLQTPISDAPSSKVAIAEGIQYPMDMQADYDMVPNDFKIWYTEYGETKGIAEETWADAVRYATLTYAWLTRGDKVNQLDFHHITDNTVVKVETPMRLAPVGIASKQFMLATAEMTEMQQINFDTNPVSVNEVLSLYGYKFKNDEKEAILVLNLNENDIQNVKFDNLFTYTGTPKMTQYYSNSPWVSDVALGDSNIILNTEDITTTFNARKFSITVIEVSKESLSINMLTKEDISIFPNPFTNNIYILDEDVEPEDINIFSVLGRNIRSQVKITKSNKIEIDTSKIEVGAYYLVIGGKGKLVCKFK